MPDTDQRRNVLVTLLFVVFGGPGILTCYVPALITRWRLDSTPLWSFVLSIVLITTGLLPLAESVLRFLHEGKGTLSPSHPTKILVEQGPYRYVRNPMYLGVLTIIAGQVVLFRSRALCLYLSCVAIGFHLFVTLYEEPKLLNTYRRSYEEYCRRVPRWIPRVR